MTRLEALEANAMALVKIVDDLQHEIEALKVILQAHAVALRKVEKDAEELRASMDGWRQK